MAQPQRVYSTAELDGADRANGAGPAAGRPGAENALTEAGATRPDADTACTARLAPGTGIGAPAMSARASFWPNSPTMRQSRSVGCANGLMLRCGVGRPRRTHLGTRVRQELSPLLAVIPRSAW
jgi:hypothetical protein